MRRFLALAAAVPIVAGCAVSKDGVGFAQRAPSSNQIAETREQLQSNAAATAPAADGGAPADHAAPGILIIGTTGPFRAVSDREREEFYRSYVAFAAQWHPGTPPRLDAAAFQAKLAGWASIETSGVPGIMSWRSRVLVPASAVHDTQFASAAGSFMFGTTGDLVAARGDDDGLVWLERVLCRDGAGYRDCAKDYRAGVFDENSGLELDRHRRPKVGGAAVDVSSYLKLPDNAVRHAASELDMRDARRCDCNRATPGSVGSAVPTPQLDNR
jgi:hypothetical protein